MKKGYILAFGNPVYDVIRTPAIQNENRILSGCSTNACLVASKLGYKSLLVGTSGEDVKEKLIHDLQVRNVDSIILDSKCTGGFHLTYDLFGNRDLSIIGVAEPLPNSIPDLPEPSFIMLGPILGEISVDLVINIYKRYSSSPILLDPQGLLRVVKDGQIDHVHTVEFNNIVPYSTIVKANEIETFVVTGINPREKPYDAVRALYDYGPKHAAIVTLAEAGSVIYDGLDYYEIPPYTTNAIDPTGAGDTYAAGFMIKYQENPYDITKNGCFASSVASVMVENCGPDFPLTHEETNRRFNILLNSTQKLKL